MNSTSKGQTVGLPFVLIKTFWVMSTMDHTLIIILAAGLGKRMQSPIPKVLHELMGIPIILYVVKTAYQLVGENIIVVIGNQAEKVRQTVSAHYNVNFVFQEKQLGTGHAVLCALPIIPVHIHNVLILCGDVPLIKGDTILSFIQYHQQNDNDVSILAAETEYPTGYGRLLFDKNGTLTGIVEEADATEQQKQLRIINTGILCIKKNFLIESLPKAGINNAQGEIYLTEIIEIGFNIGRKLGASIYSNVNEFIGINTQDDLKNAERIVKTY